MLHQIGIGTLGPVFRTYEPTRDRLVAVKAFRLDIVPEQAHALAAGLSRATKASLFHPSIVEPVDAGVEGTVAYRAEEYVAAESLDVAMRHYAPAPIEKALPFITQLAGAIDFARAAGIGHGGLHPRDIFVTPDEARATGFGVVDALEQVGIRAPIRRPYSAPERIDGRAWSTQADVFSLAAITFELLTGKRPSGTGAQIGALPDSEHAAAIHAVLARAMEEYPADRYGSALAFASALEAASQGRRLTDAVSVVAAIAAAPPIEPTRADPNPVEPDVPAPSAPAPAPVAAAVAEPPVIAAPTPDEFEIEAALDPVDTAARSVPPRDAGLFDPPRDAGLFDHEEEPATQAIADAPREERFALLDEDEAPAAPTAGRHDEPAEKPDDWKMLEDESPAEAALFHARESEPAQADDGDRGRPAILPFAVVSVLMLLIGFAGGYFVGNRARVAPPQDARETREPSTAPNDPAASSRPRGGMASGAATAETPGRYSEQKVTPPAPSADPARPPAPSATPPAAADSRPSPSTPAATKGQIVVRSVPSRAGVTVNGLWRGRTPLTLDGLALGPYVIRVVQGGYRVAREELTLSARDPSRTITLRLEPVGSAAPAPAAPAPSAPAVTTGSLYIDSRPRGATVMVDGRSAGLTPVTLTDVVAGPHVVRIEMTGKKTVTANPRVVAGQIERVTVSLEDR